MDQLHVVGHTADRRYLIVARDGDGDRFSLPVDSELVALVEDLTGESLGGAPADDDDLLADDDEADASASEPAGLAALGVAAAEPSVPDRSTGARPAAAPATAKEEAAANGAASQLPPREIQARLRAGHSVRSVAKAAGTSTERIQPWLRAVEGEREQVLAAWRTARLSRARLGPSHDLLGDAVRNNLRAKGVDPDAATWKVRRTDGQAYWTVELRYTSRGHTQRALYRYYPERAEVEPRNDLAEKIGWTRGSSGSEVSAASQPLTAAARRAAQPAGKKRTTTSTRPTTGAGGTTKKKSAPKKAAGKKTAGKKAATKKAATKKAATKKAATKKAATKKAATKKAATKKAAPKKAAEKRPAPKKAAGQQAAAKKTAEKGPATKKAAPKKAAGQRPAAKKTAEKGPAAKKVAPKEAAGEQPAAGSAGANQKEAPRSR